MKFFRLVSLTVFAQAAIAQQPAQIPASIQGMVVRAETGGALGKATVELRDLEGSVSLAKTRTDDDGKFFIPSAPPGQYRLIATRDGYVKSEYGSRPNGPTTSLTLAAGQRMRDIRIVMSQGGVISGRITDRGRPVGIADVVALKATYVDAQPEFTAVLSAKTNDQGEYRIFWLPPGRYYVVGIIWDDARGTLPLYVTPDGPASGNDRLVKRTLRAVLNRAIGSGIAENEAHIPVYFPGTTDSNAASPIEIRPGTDARNIDIEVNPAPFRHIRGRVTGLPADVAATFANPKTTNFEGLRSAIEVVAFPLGPRLVTADRVNLSHIAADVNGSFDLDRTPEGSYVVFAVLGRDDDGGTGPSGMGAPLSVELRDHDLNVNLPFSPMLTIKGRIAIEAGPVGAPQPDVKELQVVFRMSVLNESRSVKPDDDGSFKIEGMAGWDYSVLVEPLVESAGIAAAARPPALQNAYVKSILLGETDVLNGGLHIESQLEMPLEIVIGMNPGSIHGRVLNGGGQPAASVWLALIPENGQRFRVNHVFTSTDSSGQYQLQGIPPGDYKMFAWEEVEKGAWQDPIFVRDYENSGTLVHAIEGGRVEVDLKLIPPR